MAAGSRAASVSERILSAWLIAIRSLTVAALTDPIFGTASQGPVAHPVTHENARAVSPVGIGIAVAIAIGRHFDIDSDSEPDSDPEIPSEHSIFETVVLNHGMGGADVIYNTL